MVVHKKVAKAAKKFGMATLRAVGVRFRKPAKKRSRVGPGGSRSATTRRSPLRVAQAVTLGLGRKGIKVKGKTTGRSGLARRFRGLRRRKSPVKQVGPPKVGFRTVKGRRGKRVLIKRPRPRNV